MSPPSYPFSSLALLMHAPPHSKEEDEAETGRCAPGLGLVFFFGVGRRMLYDGPGKKQKHQG